MASFAGNGNVASSAPSQCGSDVFDDEERMGDLLKSLISAKGLNTAWQRVGKRLQEVELGLKEEKKVLDDLPKAFISRGEYCERVETQHEALLREHAGRLEHLEEQVVKLSQAVFQDHGPKLEDGLQRLAATESSQASVQEHADALGVRAEDFMVKVSGELQGMLKASAEQRAQDEADTKQLKASVEEAIRGLAAQIPQFELQMKAITESQIQRSNPEPSEHSGDGAPTDPQTKMLEFVNRHLLEPFRQDVDAGERACEELRHELTRQKEDFTREFRGVQKTAVDAGIRAKQLAVELKADIEMRSKRADVQKMEQSLHGEFKTLVGTMSSLQGKVTLKLNEFLDHLGKLHETIDDHEHCLRHHAEEIENRSTKYELLMCQHQLERCAQKEEFLRETAEMKSLLNWQTGKIESFGLVTATQAKKKRVAQVAKELRQASRARRLVDRMATASSSLASPDGLEEGSSGGTSPGPPVQRSTHSSLGSELAAGPARAIPEGSEPPVTPKAVLAAARAGGTGGLDTSLMESQADDLNDLEVEGDESEDGSDIAPASSIVRQQLEGVSMGLVGLGHLVLRETRLGTSRQAKLIQEKELLDELMNLRHWISNRMAPSGWNPSKLTSVALRCAHPREDESRLPLPQVSLNRLMGSESEDVRSPRIVKRFPSADPVLQNNFGPKNAPALAPLSARDPVTSSGLPPLQGFALSAA